MYHLCRTLEQKLTEAKSKKDTLKARAKSAQTTRQINDMIQGLNTSNAMTAFERMEEKVLSLEAQSDATLQVRCCCPLTPLHSCYPTALGLILLLTLLVIPAAGVLLHMYAPAYLPVRMAGCNV